MKNVLSIPRNGLVFESLSLFPVVNVVSGAIQDTSGNGNNGTATSITYVDTNVGYLYKKPVFGGSSKIDYPDAVYNYIKSTNNFSMSFWYNYTVGGMIFSVVEGTNPLYMYQNSDGSLWISRGGTTIGTSAGYTTTGKDYFVTVTFTGTTAYVFVNGYLAIMGTVGATSDVTGNFRLGQDKDAGQGITGNIQNFRIYNRSITTMEGSVLLKEGLRNLAGDSESDLLRGLVAYYDMNGNANNLVAHSNNGTVTGATLTTDRFGIANNAYNFNGSSSYISFSTITTGTSATFSFWINKNSNLDQCVFIEEAYSNNSMFFYEAATNTFVYRFGSDNGLSSTATPISNSTRNLVTITHTGTTATIYINGTEDATGTVNAKTSSGTSFTMGRLTETLYYLNGSLDDFMVFNRALSSYEVKKLYNISKVKYLYP